MRRISKLNEDQKRLAETTEGMVIADAGPGTGKTFTIVDRYMNIINKDVDPSKILMITFTRNGAQEMNERITNELFQRASETPDEEKKTKYINTVKNVRTSTFDALCLRIVMNSPDIISDFFGIKEVLSRNVRLSENDTLNRQFFERFYTEFAASPEVVEKYGNGKDNILAAMSGLELELFSIIGNLMCRGVIPKNRGWFDNGESIVLGHPGIVSKTLKGDLDAFDKKVKEIKKKEDDYSLPEDFVPSNVSLIDQAVDEDRSLLIDFIHDLYFSYIRKSISENVLTFGLASIFAFSALYEDERTRRSNKVDYLMVDEFQDTNELQMLVCLLILDKPNLCVVGDWKQSIYEFRYANMENIVEFDDRVDLFVTKLNKGGVRRVPFKFTGSEKINLRINYRSSETVLHAAFDVFNIEEEKPKGEIVELSAERKAEIGGCTGFELIQADSKEMETKFVVSKILEYVNNEDYWIIEDGKRRRPCFKDIAVLCRNGKTGTDILDECISRKIPAFYQGDMEIMSTREGKLALAWLRYVNNVSDKRGLITILADCGYSLAEIKSFIRKDGDRTIWVPPKNIVSRREFLRTKRRRPNDLLTAIFRPYRNLDPDIVQTIINILSSAYDGSLSTISDLILMIEKDISNGTKFDMDQSLRSEAVTIQTLHKSKGLEYPIVIIAGLDTKIFPSTKGNSSRIVFGENIGIRFKKELLVNYINGAEQVNVCRSWRWDILSNAYKKDPLEEIRLFFVGLTRAKQYITLTAGNSPSSYFKHFKDMGFNVKKNMDVSTKNENHSETGNSIIPDIGDCKKIRRNISVHDVMDTFVNVIPDEQGDEIEGKGPEYGEKVHKMAYLIGKGIEPTENYPDLVNVRKIIDGLKGSELKLEIKCAYPVGNTYVIRGVIDVLAIFDDHIEIHDYKTDTTRRFLKAYEAQLSIYHHCVKEFYGDSRPIRCYIDFISPDYDESKFGPRSHNVEVLSIDDIKKSTDVYEESLKSEDTERTIDLEI